MNTTLPAIKNIAKINNQQIQVVTENGQKLVPIKPICEILGIDHVSQKKRIQRDPILSSVEVMMTSTGADKKQYEMTAIPLQYIFGWLFTIQIERVNEESRPAILSYQRQCYDALWKHFSGHAEYVEY
ncbi:MAG: phage antirepressor N-terminal domain-containing protein, partial [Actinomycetota bacterium]|nr:phage antirepressor N-terminal domain-containing protein [Actinomycetota bacterium]